MAKRTVYALNMDKILVYIVKLAQKNLCIACEVEHSEHDTMSMGILFSNKKDLDKRMNELKENIKK